jgi:hypothetical protein
MSKRYNIVVGIPNTGVWRDETAKSVALMFSYFSLQKHVMRGVAEQSIGLLTVQGSVVAQQRHMCVKKACQDKTRTHLLFIDSDMEFPMTLAHRLLVHDKDIVAANCTTRASPIETIACDFDDKRIISKGKTGLQKVRQVGCAVMLINLDVFRKLRPPFFLSDWIPDIGAYCGEDVYFCQKVQEAGYDVWIDHAVSCEVKHVGTRAYGHEDVDEAKILETVQ